MKTIKFSVSDLLKKDINGEDMIINRMVGTQYQGRTIFKNKETWVSRDTNPQKRLRVSNILDMVNLLLIQESGEQLFVNEWGDIVEENDLYDEEPREFVKLEAEINKGEYMPAKQFYDWGF